MGYLIQYSSVISLSLTSYCFPLIFGVERYGEYVLGQGKILVFVSMIDSGANLLFLQQRIGAPLLLRLKIIFCGSFGLLGLLIGWFALFEFAGFFVYVLMSAMVSILIFAERQTFLAVSAILNSLITFLIAFILNYFNESFILCYFISTLAYLIFLSLYVFRLRIIEGVPSGGVPFLSASVGSLLRSADAFLFSFFSYGVLYLGYFNVAMAGEFRIYVSIAASLALVIPLHKPSLVLHLSRSGITVFSAILRNGVLGLMLITIFFAGFGFRIFEIVFDLEITTLSGFLIVSVSVLKFGVDITFSVLHNYGFSLAVSLMVLIAVLFSSFLMFGNFEKSAEVLLLQVACGYLFCFSIASLLLFVRKPWRVS